MPVELLSRRGTAARCAVNPRYRNRLAAHGLDDAAALLELPGEVVSGHPDRHVVRVDVPEIGTCYLKRQHRVDLGERLRQWRAGFGGVSRCVREATVLRELHASGFAAPNWIAYGECGGRAFLLVEELNACVELRRFLSDSALSLEERRHFVERFARTVAELHAAGFTTPELTAKHAFVNPDTFAITLIDWQNASRAASSEASGLGSLHASLAEETATPSERLRFLWAYRRTARIAERFSVLARRIDRDAARLASRRSIRDQRQPAVAAIDQRLVWLADEAVCAIPEVAATWPEPPIAAPFYVSDPRAVEVRVALPDGRAAVLVRGHCFAPFARLRDRLRGRCWRSPGATIGRVLFHLQRYGIPAPQLFAFGQRLTGVASAEWFALYEPPTGRPITEAAPSVEALLAQLHDAGCRPDLRAGLPFWCDRGRACVGDPRGIRIVRRVTARDRRADRRALFNLLSAR